MGEAFPKLNSKRVEANKQVNEIKAEIYKAVDSKFKDLDYHNFNKALIEILSENQTRVLDHYHGKLID